ncbi:NodT family efflux transporter outer membrane factor (OMF) lipoprotein [Dysgonomonas hofstadii]|uniref:NodT family efflux transporter outer membrane factor (OMF) lipoprotein n=1 Tax=Dysgonomonas hofstadii TaxID=637886 RepID=A0A840CHT7_9BACT|nr:efflux transporter outer membrane subunit [Dysgonomonas hofstadii]MBB4035577.1 NodT family efflux transporter outer membrane factor (OMF) lipoprotein [Dysgonomonas hofstadii]
MNKINIKWIVLLGVILSIGLSSCQVVNKYKAPEVDAEGLFRDMNPTDTTSIANIPWREYFSDPILQSLIDEGLNNSYDMAITNERIKQAEAALGMARAAYFPSLALGANATHNRYSVSPNGRVKELGYGNTEYMVGITASWELDVWGKLNRQSRAKFADMLNSYAGRNLVQTSLIANIANTYYTILSLDEQLRVTREMIGLMQESVDAMEDLKEAGFQNRAAVEQMKATLYSAQVSIPDLESNIRQLENSICLMLGRKPGSVLRTTIKEQDVPTELKYGLPIQMLAKRPDVVQAELSFRSTFELTNAARASFYPSINITSASLGYAGTLFKPENLAASIVGSIMQPIFAKKQLITQLKVAKAEEQAALLTFEKTILTAATEVSDIIYTYESSLSKNDVRSRQVESLTLAVSDTKELLNAGEANYLEVITAQQNLLQARLDQVSDKLEQLQASVNLYKALGGGTE